MANEADLMLRDAGARSMNIPGPDITKPEAARMDTACLKNGRTSTSLDGKRTMARRTNAAATYNPIDRAAKLNSIRFEMIILAAHISGLPRD